MTALARLRERGLRLHMTGEQLIVAPSSALTDELRALIRAQKRSILDELAGVREAQRAARQTKVEAQLRTHPCRISSDRTQSISSVGDHLIS